MSFQQKFWRPGRTPGDAAGVAENALCWNCGTYYRDHSSSEEGPALCPCIYCVTRHAPTNRHQHNDAWYYTPVWLSPTGTRGFNSSEDGQGVLCLRCGRTWGQHSGVICNGPAYQERVADLVDSNMDMAPGDAAHYLSRSGETAPRHLTQRYMHESGDTFSRGEDVRLVRTAPHTAEAVIETLSKPVRVLTPAPYLTPKAWNKTLLAFQKRIGKPVVVCVSDLWKSSDAPGFRDTAVLFLKHAEGHNRLEEASGGNYVFMFSGDEPKPSKLLALLEQAERKVAMAHERRAKSVSAILPSREEFDRFCASVAAAQTDTVAQGLRENIVSLRGNINAYQQRFEANLAELNKLGGEETVKAAAAKHANALRKAAALNPQTSDLKPIGLVGNSFRLGMLVYATECTCANPLVTPYRGHPLNSVTPLAIVGVRRYGKLGRKGRVLYSLSETTPKSPGRLIGICAEHVLVPKDAISASAHKVALTVAEALGIQMREGANYLSEMNYAISQLKPYQNSLKRREDELAAHLAAQRKNVAKLTYEHEYQKLVGIAQSGKLTAISIKDGYLFATTNDIILTKTTGGKVRFGKLEMQMHSTDTDSTSFRFRGGKFCTAERPPVGEDYRDYFIHPHAKRASTRGAYGYYVCMGEAQHHIQAALRAGKVGDVLILSCEVLYRYNASSPLAHLENWADEE